MSAMLNRIHGFPAPLSKAVRIIKSLDRPACIASVQFSDFPPEKYDRVKALLDGWAEWMARTESTARGLPHQSPGAPDARIHCIEDLEIEADKRTVQAVNTAVWELPMMQRQAVLTNYGINKYDTWRANFVDIFDLAVESLFHLLKKRISV